ncbi:uncharacterized protein V1513DRAFT_307525 [Lipomyces chichibuensis]|uniref:uncharacterized protein n=1 Tax=Lipomyces chichibuensis TaxID=1546026 RepID=UPI00334436BF
MPPKHNNPHLSTKQSPLSETTSYPTEARFHHRRNGLTLDQRSQILRYLLLGWKPEAIGKECGVSARAVFSIQSNLLRYGSVRKPYFRQLSQADENALLNIFYLKDGVSRRNWYGGYCRNVEC